MRFNTADVNYARRYAGSVLGCGMGKSCFHFCKALAIPATRKESTAALLAYWRKNGATRITRKPTASAPSPKKASGASARVNSDDFLRSFEWRKLRMQALKQHGARCQCCGATPATGTIMNVDHIKPRRLFPELALELSNLQILCDACNHGKGNWDMTDWRTTEAAQ